jgi:hypothetical protein
MKNRLKFLITLLAVFTYILWWGGFTFYAAFVIHTGQKVLGGDHVMMGFITEDVAPIISYAALVACFFSFVHEWLQGEKMRRFVVISLCIMLLLIIGLFILYPFMRELLDNQTHKEIDHDKFYFLHRIYLIISSAMWVNGVVYIILLIKKFKSSKEK